MSTFVDTSAFYALLVSNDVGHEAAKRTFNRLLAGGQRLVTSNYVVVETCALLQNRLGLPAVRCFHEDLVPIVRTEWVGEAVHEAGVSAILASDMRGLSLVDCTSFALMRQLGIRAAFTFDKHFAEQGFATKP